MCPSSKFPASRLQPARASAEVLQGFFPTVPQSHSQSFAPVMRSGKHWLVPHPNLNLPAWGKGTGIPAGVRQRMETFLTNDFSSVRIHVGADAPRIGARAFTRGENIYFAPGQYDPVGLQGQLLLIHELTHVVQQRQGRVTNPFGAGVAVVNDSALEAEADAMAQQWLRPSRFRATPPRRLCPSHLSGVVPSTQAKRGGRTVSGSTIQRKIGFEFQSVGVDATEKWRFLGKHGDSDDEQWTAINHTKKILFYTKSGRAGLSADNGDVEFSTEPLRSKKELLEAMNEMAEVILFLQKNKDTEIKGPWNQTAKQASGMSRHMIRTSRKELVGRPQATLGITLSFIPDLFVHLLEMAQSSEPWFKNIANPTLLYQMNTALSDASSYLSATQNGLEPLDSLESAQIFGLMAIILKTAWDAYSNSCPELSDPKTAFPFMPRTDFRSMFLSMEPAARQRLTFLWDNSLLQDAMDSKYPGALDSPLFPGGYTKEGGGRSKGPTTRDWLTSIIKGPGAKDLLSPPPGYPSHQGNASDQGIGAMGMDGNLALFEFREFLIKGPIHHKDWFGLASAFAEHVAPFSGDWDEDT